MATSIQSTALDFNTIKNGLKDFLSTKSEFSGYDFEASGLSNILDVLAYNTHQNALIANFAINESYLGTAQLRSSMVSLASTIGYIPGSVSSSEATINVSVNLEGVDDRPNPLTLPSGTKFTGSVDGNSYTFQTKETLIAYDDGDGLYTFTNLSESSDIIVYEGVSKTKRFIVAPYADDTIYVIPDENVNLESITVRVYNASSTPDSFVEYTNILLATEVSDTTRYYYIKESPNGFFEMNFGDGKTLGAIPKAGNIIEVTYLSSKGSIANGVGLLKAKDGISVNNETYTLDVTTLNKSVGGSEKEGIESIRKNAPFQFASQNRMVTASDYASTIMRNFPTIISDIKSFGGEEADQPKFGVVYLCVLFNDDVSNETITRTKSAIRTLVERLSIVTFGVEFIDPITTYIETQTYFQYNPALTNYSKNSVQNLVEDIVSNYFDDNTGMFDRNFRRSNMLSLIDESDEAILSSRADIKMQRRITPTLTTANEFRIVYPMSISAPDDVNTIISSSPFRINGDVVSIKNKLNTTKLQVLKGNDVVVDNVGYYEPSTGVVVISGLIPDTIIGELSYLKISAVPANQSAVTPSINNILKHDAEISSAIAVSTSAEN